MRNTFILDFLKSLLTLILWIFKRALDLSINYNSHCGKQLRVITDEMCAVTLFADYIDKILVNGFRLLVKSIILTNRVLYLTNLM